MARRIGLCCLAVRDDPSYFFLERYFPSLDWLRALEPYVTFGSAADSVLGVYITFLGFQHQARVTGKHPDSLIVASTLLFVLFLFYYRIADFVRRGVPAILAHATGHQVEHAFVVVDAQGLNRKGCSRPVEIEDMPIMTMLCGMPIEFRSHLVSGETVIFAGNGTWMGLFVEDFRKP